MIKGSVEKGCPFKLIHTVVVEFSRVRSELRARSVRAAAIVTKPLFSENTTFAQDCRGLIFYSTSSTGRLVFFNRN